MKTVKITDETHWELTQLITKIYKDTGVKMTFSEAINWIYIYWERRYDK